MILVTGATGNVGSELTRALAANGNPVRVLARQPGQASFPAGVQVAAGDLEDLDSLAPALDGVSKVFLLGGFATAGVLRRIRTAGAEHVVLLTSRCVIGGNPQNAVTRMWLDAEAAVRDSGPGWTILRPSSFHSNALRWLPQLREGDVVRAPWPAVPTAAIDPADIAAVASVVLTEPGDAGAALALSGGEFDDSAATTTVREITGQPPRTFGDWAPTYFGDAGQVVSQPHALRRPAILVDPADGSHSN
jgi:uncharacterized protein YbjT (DUF2867 family)